MDLYDVGRTAVSEWLRRIEVPILLVGIRSDWLFPPGAIRALGDRLRGLGKESSITSSIRRTVMTPF